MHDDQTRRRFLVSGAAAATGLTLALPDLAAGQQLPLTPECKGASEVTIRQTEGPFFKPSSPKRADLREPGLKGELIVVSGLVLTRGCKPVANALVDLWHADGNGDYDNKGFRGRGHQFTDGEGRYNFITVRPARYPGRTPHYHSKHQLEPVGGEDFGESASSTSSCLWKPITWFELANTTRLTPWRRAPS